MLLIGNLLMSIFIWVRSSLVHADGLKLVILFCSVVTSFSIALSPRK